MNKRSTSDKKISVTQLISVFRQNPEEAYQLLISSGIYFKNKQSGKFWTQFDLEELYHSFPESEKILDKARGLKFFYDINSFYDGYKIEYLEKIIALNPTPDVLIKSFFLCLELGETNPRVAEFPGYTEDALKAVKILVKEILPKLKSENSSVYSTSLVELSNHLIKLQLDLALISDFLDVFVSGDFELSQKDNGQGFLLSSTFDNKSNNLFILNNLKSFVKKDFNRKNSHSKISEEEHFKKYDPIWKTNEGLVGVLHSSGVIIKEQTPGLTSLKVEDSLFEDIRSEDPKIREKGLVKNMELVMEQNFHYQYRQALSSIYNPNDEIDIHTYKIEINIDFTISLYDLICCMSCLIAKADTYRYFDDFPMGSIKAIKNELLVSFKNKSPELIEEKIKDQVNSAIISWLPELEQFHGLRAFHFIELNTLIQWFRKIEELKDKSDQELSIVVDFFSGNKTALPYNPLYKVGDKYYFSYWTCRKFSLNELLYDYYISDMLFNSRNKIEEKKLPVDQNQKSRITGFTDSIKELFETITPFVKARLDFDLESLDSNTHQLKGDFDVIAYLEDENILFPIEVKLSNVSPRSEKRKSEWIANHIKRKGIDQINKSVAVLQTDVGLKFVSEKLNFNQRIISPRIYPMIVTDNFFSDHVSYEYNERGYKVVCVSYFEIKHLILNQKVHPKQNDLPHLDGEDKGTLLIKTIEENKFWNYIVELANEVELSKTLSVIEDKFKIEINI